MNSHYKAWSLAYLFLYARNTLRAPRNFWGATMTLSTAACAAIHAGNYFVVQDFGNELPPEDG